MARLRSFGNRAHRNPLPLVALAPALLAAVTGAGAAAGSVLASNLLAKKSEPSPLQPTTKNPMSHKQYKMLRYRHRNYGNPVHITADLSDEMLMQGARYNSNCRVIKIGTIALVLGIIAGRLSE